MAKIGLSKGSGKWSKVREKSVKSGYYLIFLYSVNKFIDKPSRMQNLIIVCPVFYENHN